MARPRKQDTEKRTRVVSFRVTDAEYAQLEAGANAAKSSVSDYARLSSLRARVEVVNAPPALSAKEAMELNRIGVNLNQLTRVANATRDLPAGLEHVARQLIPFVNRVMGLRMIED